MTTAEIARAARAVLRTAFPKSKISVTSTHYSINIRWSDGGPTVELVKETLLTAGCAETWTDWRGERYLVTPDNSSSHYYFDRYNAAERAAAQQISERRQQEREAEDQRIGEVIAQERAARYSALPSLSRQELPPVQDPSVFTAFEQLRQRAETEVQINEDTERRPSWAPPLLLGEELAELCLELGYITGDDKWIGRLWATFATPKRSGRWLRQHVSELPLEGLHCRGFALWAGAARGSQSDLLFEARREETGTCRFGPLEFTHDYQSARGREWEQLIRERERDRHELEHHELSEGRRRQLEDGIAERSRRLEVIDADDLIKARAHNTRLRLRQRALELARARVSEFVGRPDTEMMTAARLWGCCRICAKVLTDPVSLERGIGPDCHAARVDYIRRAASAGRSPEKIAALAGMPIEFVSALLSEKVVTS
jgi:Large polyvalent protein associated domain 29/Family of unknown function (DUF6011)